MGSVLHSYNSMHGTLIVYTASNDAESYRYNNTVSRSNSSAAEQSKVIHVTFFFVTSSYLPPVLLFADCLPFYLPNKHCRPMQKGEYAPCSNGPQVKFNSRIAKDRRAFGFGIVLAGQLNFAEMNVPIRSSFAWSQEPPIGSTYCASLCTQISLSHEVLRVSATTDTGCSKWSEHSILFIWERKGEHEKQRFFMI